MLLGAEKIQTWTMFKSLSKWNYILPT